MAYNTGNPIGSGDPRDLLDNSENLDEAINGTGSTWVDRLGVTRKTFKAAENAADDAETAANNAITTLIPAEVARVETDADTAVNTEIPAEVQRVETAANNGISDINTDVGLVDSAKTSGINNINADVSAVDAAKTTGLSGISADVNAVDAAKTTALSDISGDVSAVSADANDAIVNEIPAEVARVETDADTAINTEIPAEVARVSNAADTGISAITSDVGEVDTAAKSAINDINLIDNQAQVALDNAEVDWEERFTADQDDRAQRFDLFLANSGYQFVGDYAAGVELTEYNQVVRDTSGNLWRASGSTTLPYTTSGTGLPESGAFVAVGDAVLRNELANDPSTGQGALLVRGSVIYVDTIADLQALPTSELVDGQAVQVKEYYAGTGVGGGEFYWDSSANKMDHNGGTVIAAGSGSEWDGTAENLSALHNWVGTGLGCFIRVSAHDYKLNEFGIISGTTVDHTEDINFVLNKSAEAGKTCIFQDGTYLVKAGNGSSVLTDFGRGIITPNNSNIVMSIGTILKALPEDIGRYSILEIVEKNNVNIRTNGAKIVGERYEHTGTSGEQGYGVQILGSENINIDEIDASKCWGDGVVIADLDTVNYPCKDITIGKVKTYDNRRQGVSIISVDGFNCAEINAYNIQGTAPESGIDFEPDSQNQRIKNVNIDNLITDNCKTGLLTNFQKLDSASEEVSIVIGSLTTKRSRSAGLNISGPTDDAGSAPGYIGIKNYTSIENANPVSFGRKNSKSVFVEIDSLSIHKSMLVGGGIPEDNFIVFGKNTSDGLTGKLGGFAINNIYLDEKDRSSDFFAGDVSDQGFENIKIDATGVKPGGLSGSVSAKFSNSTLETYQTLKFLDNDFKGSPILVLSDQTLSSELFPKAYSNLTASTSITLTLPFDTLYGSRISIIKNGYRSLTLETTSGLVITGSDFGNTSTLSIGTGDYGSVDLVRMPYEASNGPTSFGQWFVESISGNWTNT